MRLAILLIPFVLAGCFRDRFDLYVGTDVFKATILSNPQTVQRRGQSLRLLPGARLAIKSVYATQWLGQYEVSIVEGEGLNAYIRTVSDRFDGSTGVVFRWATDGCTVRASDGRTVPINFNAEVDRQTLSFYNEAELLTISAGCNRLYEEHSPLPGTEYVILETLPNSTVDVTSISYFDSNTY